MNLLLQLQQLQQSQQLTLSLSQRLQNLPPELHQMILDKYRTMYLHSPWSLYWLLHVLYFSLKLEVNKILKWELC